MKLLRDGQFLRLLALLKNGELSTLPLRDAYERRHRPIAIFAVYMRMEALEKLGYVTIREADPTADRDGKPRRYFKLTDAALAALDSEGK